jgi:hypothetical protein
VHRVALGATGFRVARDRLDPGERLVEPVAALVDEHRLGEHLKLVEHDLQCAAGPECLAKRRIPVAPRQEAIDQLSLDSADSSQPCAIVVGAATRFAGPVGLPELRRRQHAFVTPQSYRFLRDGELSSLLNGEASQLAIEESLVRVDDHLREMRHRADGSCSWG